VKSMPDGMKGFTVSKDGKLIDKSGNVKLDFNDISAVDNFVQQLVNSGKAKVVDIPPRSGDDDETERPWLDPTRQKENPLYPAGHPNGPMGPLDPDDPAIPRDPDGNPYWWWKTPWGPFVPGFKIPFGDPKYKPDPHGITPWDPRIPRPDDIDPGAPGWPTKYPPNEWPYGVWPLPDGGFRFVWPGFSPWRHPYDTNPPGWGARPEQDKPGRQPDVPMESVSPKVTIRRFRNFNK